MSEEAGPAWRDDYYGVAYAVVGIDCKMVGGGWGGRVSMLARCSVVTLVGGVAADAATGQRPGGAGGGGGGGGGEDDEDDDDEAGGAVPVFLVLDGSRFCVSRTKNGEEKCVCESKWRGRREVGV